VQLGVQGTDAVKGVGIRLDENTTFTPEVDGALIIAVNEGYCAYGKLEAFDIIIGIDGVKVTHFEALRAELYKHKVGDKVKLEVWRDGKAIEVELEL
jgi:serine protease Do